MTKYKLIPESFDGNIACYYNDAGYLLEFVINSWNIKPDGHKEILENLGYLLTEQLLPQFAQMMSMQCRKAKIDLSFDRFWIMYGYARNRIQAEKVYNKLTDMKKYYALVNLKGYLLYCKRNPGYTKMLPESYLLGHTQDNWDKVEDYNKPKNTANDTGGQKGN